MEQVSIGGANQVFAPIPAGFATRSVAGAVDVALTSSESAADIIEVTGALTGDIHVIVATPLFPQVVGTTQTSPPTLPSTINSWVKIFRNATTGVHTVTVIGPGGTGIAVTQGDSQVLYSKDGVNVLAGGAAA